MTDNDFGNIEYHGMQKALKSKMSDKLWSVKGLAETAGHEDYALVMQRTSEAMQLLDDVQNLYRRICGNKARRMDPASAAVTP